MSMALSLLILLFPAAAVLLLRKLLRGRESLWRSLSLMMVAAVWAVAVYLWVDYSRQQHDVGIMVSGMIAAAVTVSALLTTAARFLAARF